jgi:hypothetical protein
MARDGLKRLKWSMARDGLKRLNGVRNVMVGRDWMLFDM